MAILGNTLPTLSDWISRGGRTGAIFEMLSKVNEVLDDIPWQACNNGTVHKSTQRTGIPQAVLREINRGVPRVKSQTAIIQDTTAMLEVYAEIDKVLVDMQKGGALPDGSARTQDAAQKDFRASEAAGVIEGMSQQMATLLFYGNNAQDTRSIVGFTPRFSNLNPAVKSSEQIVDAGGTGSANTSAWLVTWGDRTAHGIYPEGMPAGLTHRDLGEHTLLDPTDPTLQFQGYRDHFAWHFGVSVRDHRYISRVANIDMTVMGGNTAELTKLIGYFIEAGERLFSQGAGNTVWYVNRRLRALFRRAILEKIATNLTWETIAGKRVMMFDGYPVRMTEALLSTESRVVSTNVV